MQWQKRITVVRKGSGSDRKRYRGSGKNRVPAEQLYGTRNHDAVYGTGTKAGSVTDAAERVLYFVQTQQSVTVDKDEFRIGKNAGMSDYVITNNSSVSRQHAVIQRRNGQFFVTDLGSTNGTFVNEKRISGTVQLQDGDNIRYVDVISVFNIVR